MKEDYFLKYNEDNLMKNALAIEDHARYLKSGYSPEHVSCITKHSLIIEEEADEAISHSSVAKPEKTNLFIEIRDGIKEFRKDLQDGGEPKEIIKKIRTVRKKIEKVNPAYNLDKCSTCGEVEHGLDGLKEKVYKGEQHNINSNFKIGENVVTRNQVISIAAGNFIGKGVTLAGEYLDAQMGATGATILKRPSTILNIGGGILGCLAALYYVKDEKIAIPLVIASTHMLTKSVDYATELTRGKALLGGPSVSFMGRRAGLQMPSVGAIPEFTDRGLINVD